VSFINVHFYYERLVSSLATDTHDANADQQDARVTLERQYRKQRNEHIILLAAFFGGIALLWLTAALGILLTQGIVLSAIWLFPLFLLVTPLVYGAVASVKSDQIAERFVIAAVAAIVMTVSLVLVIKSGYVDDLFGAVVGNAVMGYQGVSRWTLLVVLPIGVIISLGLTFVVSIGMYAVLVRELIRDYVSIGKALLLAALTPLFFMLAMGLSVVVNSGW
jgi:hypothetical protein